MIEKPVGDNNMSMFHPIIFPVALCHVDIANAILATKEMEGAKVVSAGFTYLSRSIEVFGESLTLGLQANVERDATVIGLNSYGMGWGERTI